ncbi:uncharacterized protein LOC113306147 [Papaver somniferum]|uniref:uncharacterized protein LOC113306147 n=1 Tax=Papaver somniferum TaxID=3469 RepID=UPI000E7002CC|nr:uncharacterized protein LOC113306147 [Papaver somniferum]
MSEQVLQAKENMDNAQLLLKSYPLDQELARRERDYVTEYVRLDKYEESVHKQLSRVKWLDLGDANTSFFHNSLKERRSRNNISFFYDNANVKLTEDKGDFYGDFLNLRFEACVQQEDVADLIKPVTREEMVIALNSIGSSKAPSRDGFSSHFFKTSWSIVGDELVAVVQKKITKSKLLKEPDIIDCTWISPATDEIMINTDVSKSDDGGSFRAILRGNNAEVLSVASSEISPISVLAHELQGVELGLKMFIKIDQLRVHIATDFMVVYNLLTNPDPELPWSVLQI